MPDAARAGRMHPIPIGGQRHDGMTRIRDFPASRGDGRCGRRERRWFNGERLAPQQVTWKRPIAVSWVRFQVPIASGVGSWSTQQSRSLRDALLGARERGVRRQLVRTVLVVLGEVDEAGVVVELERRVATEANRGSSLQLEEHRDLADPVLVQPQHV